MNSSNGNNGSGMQPSDAMDLHHQHQQQQMDRTLINTSANLTGRKHARAPPMHAATVAAYIQQQQHLHLQTQHMHQMHALMAHNNMVSDPSSLGASVGAHALVTGNGVSMMSELHAKMGDVSDADDDDDDEPNESGETEEDETAAATAATATSGASSSNSPTDASSSAPTSGARRMRLTLGQKREVVDLAASKKFTHRELAEQFNVGRTTITNICRQEELIRTETDSADAIKKKRKTTKFSYDMRVLDECLHKWRMEVKVSSPDTKITGTVLQQKAMDLSAKILQEPYANLPDKVRQALTKFTASNGWLDGYRMRFGSFSSKVLVGDQSVIKNVDIQTRLRELHHSLHGVDLQDIWTGSEFAIMTKPSANGADTSATTGAASASDFAAAGRFTLSLFTSAAGETFDLQVIGVDRNPLLLDSVDPREAYRIQYGHSKNGCQVAHTTVAMLKSLNALAKSRKRTFRVLLDSAVPHVKAAMILDSQGDHRTFFVYDHLQLYFLPPNFKPLRFHPCHLGIIQAFKARFRYEVVETLFSVYRQCVLTQDGFHPLRHMHTRNVFHWFHIALQSLDKHLIQTCWVLSGLLPTQALMVLNMKEHTSTGASSSSSSSATTAASANASASSVALATGQPIPVSIYSDLQKLMNDVTRVAPDFLQWIGVADPSNAQAYAELEGNASVTDPGIDEVQIIRSVLQKNDFLHTKRLDDALHAAGQFETLSDIADEHCPRHDEVLTAIETVKKYLRLSRDAIPNRVDAVVQLNKVKTALGSTAVHDV